MNNKIKVCAVVVTYVPNRDVQENLFSIAKNVDCLLVVDNTPGTSNKINEFNISNAKYILNNKNMGLGWALNKGVQTAALMGADYVFLFDQDTRPTCGFFKEMITFAMDIDQKYDNCAFCVPNFFDRFSKTYATFPVISPFIFRHLKCPYVSRKKIEGALIAITSGTIINIKKYNEIGPFCDDYFIDFIDNEYCLRAGSRNYFVAVNCKATINHSIGRRDVKKVFGVTFKPNHHSALRRYYIARNGFLTALKYYKRYPSYFILIVIRLMHEFFSIVLFEKNKRIKIVAMMYGIYYGTRGIIKPYYNR